MNKYLNIKKVEKQSIVNTTGSSSELIMIKTHSHVSVAKKAMWHTSVLFTGTANSLFSTPLISITTGLISIKFIFYALHIRDPTRYVFLRIAPFSSHFSLHCFTKITLNQQKTPFLWINFFQIWHP